MKFYIRFGFLFPVFLFCLTSCEKEQIKLPIEEHPVFFQYQYINHAWGFVHNGILVDSLGKFHYFSMPENWTFPDNDGIISKEALLNNLVTADSIDHTISPYNLHRSVNLINEVDNDSFSKAECHAFDGGGFTVSCFQWNEINGQYKEILLNLSGNCNQRNLDPDAFILTKLLIEEMN